MTTMLKRLGMALALAVVSAASASAEVTRMTVTSSGPSGVFYERSYLWANATMEGTVTRADGSTGAYRVPVVLMYPDRNPNGFGFVDVVNSADFLLYKDEDAPGGKRAVLHAGDVIFSDYLKREGYAYISVQWSRMVTEELGAEYGMIEDGRDGYEIVRDAARFLRNPRALRGDVAFRPQTVSRVIAFGKSQTALLLRHMVVSGEDRGRAGETLIDGFLAGSGGSMCLSLSNDATPRAEPGPTAPTFSQIGPCDGALPPGRRYIDINAESDFNPFLNARLARAESAGSRQYELAGVAHIPPFEIDVSKVGGTRQNPASYRPVYKAALHNLKEWIESGTEPPPSVYLAGAPDGEGVYKFETDADGNVLGGVRLPHMPSNGTNGHPAGAPLGVYRGIDPRFWEPLNIYALFGGMFTPFPAEELAQRYPTAVEYRKRVERAANGLLDARLILREDYEAYIAEARRWGR